MSDMAMRRRSEHQADTSLSPPSGYHTGLVGKWGLGNFGSTGYPLAMGFDEFIGQDSQVACHNWYPYLIQNNTLDNYTLPKNQHASEATCGPNRTKCTWSNDYFSDRANEFVTRAARGTKPFFLYFSTTTPHAGDLAGAHSENPTPAPYNQRFTEWGQQQDDFASAVSAMDDFVGRIMSTLKANNMYAGSRERRLAASRAERSTELCVCKALPSRDAVLAATRTPWCFSAATTAPIAMPSTSSTTLGRSGARSAPCMKEGYGRTSSRSGRPRSSQGAPQTCSSPFGTSCRQRPMPPAFPRHSGPQPMVCPPLPLWRVMTTSK